ncbi:uncharacterized protein Pyn_18919 [Prunus yedoensis var. nudiflora]|uniref:Uncharacterized protein n=1 Tax=Prunus yedoensis var. nudiflora TaxID=2094558 RepID=A0A314YVD4_PRUYE|nr:uncharacterized protein Pyn_18919 [Prunus yedoensis var. nudiflora]
MANAADHISSSPVNHFHSSSSSGMVEPQTAMADDACIQLQSQPQLQQPHIALPPQTTTSGGGWVCWVRRRLSNSSMKSPRQK